MCYILKIEFNRNNYPDWDWRILRLSFIYHLHLVRQGISWTWRWKLDSRVEIQVYISIWGVGSNPGQTSPIVRLVDWLALQIELMKQNLILIWAKSSHSSAGVGNSFDLDCLISSALFEIVLFFFTIQYQIEGQIVSFSRAVVLNRCALK